jgi:hypothetical protein
MNLSLIVCLVTASIVATASASTMTASVPNVAMTVEESIKEQANREEVQDDVDSHVVSDPFEHPLVLPTLPISQWPHQTILLQVGVNTHFLNTATTTTSSAPVASVSTATEPHQQSLPIGVPIDFETALFRGQFMIRLRNNTSDDPKSHDDYFRDRKRVLQTVVQGKFKKSIAMSDLYVGTVFRQPMKYAPPPFFMRMLRGLFQRIAPGAILDFASDKPRIISLYAGSAKAISIDVPGQEPDIRSIDLTESIANLDKVQQQQELLVLSNGKRKSRKNRKNASLINTDPSEWSIADRKRILSNPDTASHYIFDTEHVYTMEVYDDAMDYGKYEIRLPIYGNFNFSEAIGVQPMTFTAVTKQNEIMYDFALWHESVLQRQSNTVATATA